MRKEYREELEEDLSKVKSEIERMKRTDEED